MPVELPADVVSPAGVDAVVRSLTVDPTSPYSPNSEAATGASLIDNEFWIGAPGSGAGGATDDQALFDNAMTLVAALGGGTINCQPGTYRAEPRLKSYIKLKGANHYATIIKRRTASSTADVIALFSARQEQCEVEDLQVDGNTGGSGGAGTGNGVYFHNDSLTNGAFASGLNNPRHRIRNVFARNCYGDGISTDGDGNAGACEVSGCSSYFCNGNGFYSTTPDSVWSNCDAGQSGLAGFRSPSTNNRFVGCKAWLSGRVTAGSGDGFSITSGGNNSLVGCVAQDNAKNGFTFFGAQNLIAEGLVADSNGTSGSGSGVYMDTAISCKISVAAFDRQGSPTQTYAVAMGTGTKNIIHVASGTELTGAISAADLLTDNIFFVEKVGATALVNITGTTTLSGATKVNGAAATNRDLGWQTAGVDRWIVRVNSTAEGGANAGSDLILSPRDDAGAALTTVLTITRSSGLITLGEAINLAAGTATGTKIGTGTTQKLGFFNATPIVQPANTTDLRTLLINLGFLASGGANPLNLNGGAMTADSVTASTTLVAGASADSAGSQFTINGAAASNRDVTIQTAGSARWILRVNNTAEGGANAGSDLTLVTRDDTGAALGTVFTIVRSSSTIALGEAVNFSAGTTTGTKIGTGTTQKLAFHGSTAVVQRAGAAQVAAATTAATNAGPFGYTTAAQADAIVTLVNEIRATLVEKGIFKGAA